MSDAELNAAVRAVHEAVEAAIAERTANGKQELQKLDARLAVLEKRNEPYEH